MNDVGLWNDSVAKRTLGSALSWHEWVLAAFMLTDFYKATTLSLLPFDITIATGIVALLAALHRTYQYGWRVPHRLGWPLAFFALALIPVLYTGWTAYAVMKVTRFYTITLLSLLVAPLILRSSAAVGRFAIAVLGIGFTMTLFSFLSQPTVPFDVGVMDVGTISLGRGYAVTILIIVLAVNAGWTNPLALFAAVPVLIALISTGNRQGLLGLSLAFLLTIIISSNSSRRRTWPWIGVVGIVLVTMWDVIAVYLPLGALDRYISLLAGRDHSAGARVEMWQAAWEGASVAGNGWGSFASLGLTGRGGSIHMYPHNIYLEAFYELGLLPAILLILLIVAAFVRLARSVRSDEKGRDASMRTSHLLLLGLLTLYVFTAGVSGDLYANKALFAIVGVALCIPDYSRQGGDRKLSTFHGKKS